MRRSFAFVLALGLLWAVLPPATASGQATTAPLPTWDKLTPAQRDTLIAPLRERWNAEPESRQRLFDHAARWKAMTPEQRARARHGMHRWQEMGPAQREEMRALFAKMRTLDPEGRAALKAKWRQMSPEQRAEWVKANPAPAREDQLPHR
ncbi:DUF3106 domain-containing protein [Lysobacter olei]